MAGTFSFDLEGAINSIASLEDAITTPTPGITNSYTYGNNPAEITDPAAFPAIVHIPLGPTTEASGTQGLITHQTYQLAYSIQSTALFVETVGDAYPADETASNLFWKSISEVFFNQANRLTLVAAAGAGVHSYRCEFPARSYDVRRWPPVTQSTHSYWSLQYTHVFIFAGG